MEFKDKLISMLGKDWYEVLSEYLHSQSFLSIGKFIKNQRVKHTVYPESKLVFRAFRETGYYQTKVLMLGQDPYFDGVTIANGLAFCCGDSIKDSPSMQFILKEIDLEYPDKQFDIGNGNLDRGNFTRLAHQGVLLLNKALTVVKNKPKSHMKQWEDFTKKIVQTLDNKPGGVVFLLLGKDAQSVKPYIKNCSIVEAAHPATHAYRGEGFLGSEVFKKVNEELKNLNKSEIHW